LEECITQFSTYQTPSRQTDGNVSTPLDKEDDRQWINNSQSNEFCNDQFAFRKATRVFVNVMQKDTVQSSYKELDTSMHQKLRSAGSTGK